MQYLTDNTRIKGLLEVTPPIKLIDKLPLSSKASKLVYESRNELSSILKQEDDRLLVVVGPCSIHDPKAAIEYAQKLKPIADALSKELKIVMRVYFEKPRTTIGWKGLINDPDIDNSFNINKGLKTARKLLLEINELGLPAGTEYLDIITPQYISDLISWGAIGARTTESQIHRELASGLSCPVGFKNSTNGSVKVAVDALKAASHSHIFLSITKEGKSAIFNSAGNQDCHVILRGGSEPNYKDKDIKETSKILKENGLIDSVMVDMSHGNSSKQFKKQLIVNQDLCNQISSGSNNIIGVMIESNLIEGNQSSDKKDKLEYGQSITDACVGWEDTEIMLNLLSSAVKNRRQNMKVSA